MSLYSFRIQSARREGNHCFRYTLRMRIGIAEGVSCMMHEYARTLAMSVAVLRRRLSNQHVLLDEETDDDDSS